MWSAPNSEEANYDCSYHEGYTSTPIRMQVMEFSK